MKFPHFPLAAIFTFLLLAGCAGEEVRQVRAAKQGNLSAENAFAVETTLCRKVSRKSGRRIGAGHDFKVGKKSYVKAFVDFANVSADRPYTVHLVWIRPDGKELFRKYAEVRQNEVLQKAEGQKEYRTIIDWLSAEDLHKVKSDTLLTCEPEFTLETRFNTSEKRAREPGLYHFRVYMDRGLLLEEPFNLQGVEVDS